MKGTQAGMRRRLDLAAGLVTHPPVLFLDEPDHGLDPTSRVRMWGIIRELVADGVTLLLTTQYLDEADELADRIVVIDHGRVIASGTATELKTRIGGHASSDPQTRPIQEPSGHSSHLSKAAIQGQPRRPAPRAPVRSGDGLATTIVRALDAAGMTVDDVVLHQPSLDDVFFALTATDVGRVPTAECRDRIVRRRDGGRAAMTVTTRLSPPLAGRAGTGLSRQLEQRGGAHRTQTWCTSSREPLQLSDVTIQPVLFTALFVYVFGAGVVLPHGTPTPASRSPACSRST